MQQLALTAAALSSDLSPGRAQLAGIDAPINP
jgi:hypothetical protein